MFTFVRLIPHFSHSADDLNVALSGVVKVAGISAVGDHKQLQELEQRMLAIKALFAVAVHLVKGFTDRLVATGTRTCTNF